MGNLYVADGSIIRRISPEGRVTALARSYFQGGYVDGEGYRARFAVAWAIATGRSGDFFVTDRDNHRIRRISYGAIPTAGFSIGMYAGLSITGTIGRSYRIEFVNSLANSNDWTTAATISLTSSPFLWVDNDSKNFPKRFYRSVLLP